MYQSGLRNIWNYMSQSLKGETCIFIHLVRRLLGITSYTRSRVRFVYLWHYPQDSQSGSHFHDIIIKALGPCLIFSTLSTGF